MDAIAERLDGSSWPGQAQVGVRAVGRSERAHAVEPERQVLPDLDAGTDKDFRTVICTADDRAQAFDDGRERHGQPGDATVPSWRLVVDRDGGLVDVADDDEKVWYHIADRAGRQRSRHHSRYLSGFNSVSTVFASLFQVLCLCSSGDARKMGLPVASTRS